LNENCIHADGLGKRFGDGHKSVQAFEGMSLDVKRGEFVCIVGPSGCGKTTLLRCLAGIEKSSEGSFRIDLEAQFGRSKLAMVFQEHGLYPWMTVEGNLRFVLEASPVPTDEHQGIVENLLGQVGLARFKGFYPHQLSGGMNQRVALVRAFCVNPQVLLMDEPFVFLDYQNRIILQNLLLKLWGNTRQTILFVTHNINEAAALADRVLVMTSGPGRIRDEIRCDFERPRDVIALRRNPDYQEIVIRITDQLRQEIEAAEQHVEAL
jgi:NitT/TauT family transport system ATP-binding protein